MRKLLLAVPFFFVAIIVFAQPKDEKAIATVMQKQVSAWNNGDLQGFMQTYWSNDSLLFVGKNGVTKGWNNTLKNYKKAYPDKTSMGELKFTLIKIQKLSAHYYNVIGKWHLTRSAGDLQGHYTLLFRKIKGKWLIVQDHSS